MRALLKWTILLCFLLLQPLIEATVQAAPGDFLYLWGAKQHFNIPNGITCDKNGNIYVVDFGWDIGHVVQVFNPAGERLRKWGSFGSGNGQFDFPAGIAVARNGAVYVADANNDRIQVFDSSGNFLRKWGSTGTGNGQFDFPLAVAIDSSGYVYVADSNNNRIQVFDSTGNFIRKWGSLGTGDGEFNYVTGLAFDGSGRLYVADNLNQRIQVFDSLGNFLKKWGSQGEGNGQFMSPWAVTVDDSGRVYVTDSYTNFVQQFDSSGTFLRKWGGTGSENGQFNGAYGIVCGVNGEIYVVDQFNDRVQIFDSSGNFLRKWWSHDAGDGELYGPNQTAIDPSGNVYVTDTNNHRIQVFSSTGTFLRKWGSNGSADGEFQWPSGIVLDGKGNVYVADTFNGRIQVFDTAGNWLRMWGASFPLRLAIDPAGNIWTVDPESSTVYVYDSVGNVVRRFGGFQDPNVGAPGTIAIDAAGTAYITDNDNKRVNVFDNAGNFLRQIGQGTFPSDAQLSGIAVDPAGNVLVTDWYGGFIWVFTNNGTLRAKWGGTGDTNGLFLHPSAISVDVSGAKIFVSDYDNNRIQVLEGFGDQLPPGWTGRDIGSVGVPGHASFAKGTFTLQGSGANIWGTADAFHFVYRPLTGDGKIIARVTAVQNTNGYAKGGLMMRQSLTANSVHAMVDITPIYGAEFSRRLSAGGSTSVTASAGITAPYWVKLVRQGSMFSGYISQNGVNWTLLGSASINMPSTIYVGLIDNSHNNAALCKVTMDNVSLTGKTNTPSATITAPAKGATFNAPATVTISANVTASAGATVKQVDFFAGTTLIGTATAAPYSVTWSNVTAGSYSLTARVSDSFGETATSRPVAIKVGAGLPAPWSTRDIGSVGVMGSATYANGAFTLRGSGADIWGSADAFRFVYRVMTGDGEIVARVGSLQNTNSYAKGGVMIRQSLAANSMHATMDLKPTGGAEFLRRTSAGGTTSATAKTGITAPYWVKLVRSGNTFTGYVSSNGTTWSQVGSATIGMTSSVYVGLIVNSHNNSVLCTATMDHLQ